MVWVAISRCQYLRAWPLWTDNNSSPMSQGTVLTLQIDMLEGGEDVGSDFKMPISPNMTAMVDASSWCGLVSAEVEEQTCTS